jgi:hypothetical protein
MADLSITAANVVKGADALVENGTAGASITAGQPVYLDDTTGKFLLSDNNAAGKKTVRGVALHAASNNQPLAIQRRGDITIGGTLTAGSRYYLSGSAGGIAPEADLASGMDVVLLGIAKTTTVLALNIQTPGVTI